MNSTGQYFDLIETIDCIAIEIDNKNICISFLDFNVRSIQVLFYFLIVKFMVSLAYDAVYAFV